MAQVVEEKKNTIWDKFTQFPRLLDIIKEFGVFKVFKAAGTPQGDEIDTLSRVNPDYPLFESVLMSYEKRLNTLHGNCAAIGRPLYPKFTFFTDTFEHYKRLTPSVGGKRAEQIFEALAASMALKSPENQERPISIGDVGKLETDDSDIDKQY